MNGMKVTMIALSGLLALSVTSAFAFTGGKYVGEAKINMQQARTIALKAYPGKITDEELEKEKGGSGLRYSFDVKKGKVIHEVGVDAKSGKVLENDQEGPNPD